MPTFLISVFSSLQSSDSSVSQKISKRDPMEEILKAFQLFDSDNSGKISVKHLKKVAKDLGENLSDDELQAMIDEFDVDKDGLISQQEFVGIMTSTPY